MPDSKSITLGAKRNGPPNTAAVVQPWFCSRRPGDGVRSGREALANQRDIDSNTGRSARFDQVANQIKTTVIRRNLVRLRHRRLTLVSQFPRQFPQPRHTIIVLSTKRESAAKGQAVPGRQRDRVKLPDKIELIFSPGSRSFPKAMMNISARRGISGAAGSQQQLESNAALRPLTRSWKEATWPNQNAWTK